MSTAIASSRTAPTAPANTASTHQPHDWRTSGTPSSPKITWEMAPHLGLKEFKDYTVGKAEGVVEGVADAAKGLWHLVSAPIETLKPWVTEPVRTFEQAIQAEQEAIRRAVTQARQGNFEPAGRMEGEQIGRAVGGAALGAAGGKVVGKVVKEVRHIQVERQVAQQAQATRAQRIIESNHSRDAPLNTAEAVAQRPVKRLGEAQAQAEAVRLERADGGHSLDRHGPQLTAADHHRRVTTGLAADRVFSPTTVSTQFHTAEDWVITREKALRFAEAKYGFEQGKPPDLAHGQKPHYVVVLEYDRPVDTGAVGVGAQHRVTNPKTGKNRNMPSQSQKIDGVTRTKTIIEWDEAKNRWMVAQHMPDARGWDNAKKAYGPSPTAHITGVHLPKD